MCSGEAAARICEGYFNFVRELEADGHPTERAHELALSIFKGNAVRMGVLPCTEEERHQIADEFDVASALIA